MAKKNKRFVATFRYVAMVEVPLEATSLAGAVEVAIGLGAGSVEKDKISIHDHEAILQGIVDGEVDWL